MKTKLVNLLNKAFDLFTWMNTDKVADYLLKNGIIVLPCHPGTKIYHIDLEIPEDEPQCSDCKDNHGRFGEFYCDNDFLGWPTFEDLLNDPKDVCPKFKPFVKEETFTLSFWVSYKEWFNRSWFFTEEEAKKFLEDMNCEKHV